MLVLDTNGRKYFDAVNPGVLFDGRWFKTSGDAVGLSLSGELELVGGGNITGDLFADFTADPEELKGITRLTLPDGSLQTTFATVVLAAQKVTLTTALTATTFALLFAYPGCGSMRFRWNPTSVVGLVAGANKFYLDCQIGLEG